MPTLTSIFVRLNAIASCAITIMLIATCVARAQAPSIEDRDIFVPSTISPEAQQVLRGIINAKRYTSVVSQADDLEAWRQIYAATEEATEEVNSRAVERARVTVTDAQLGGVPVLDIRPDDWTDNGKVLVYTHGGAYVLFSARSTLVPSEN